MQLWPGQWMYHFHTNMSMFVGRFTINIREKNGFIQQLRAEDLHIRKRANEAINNQP